MDPKDIVVILAFEHHHIQMLTTSEMARNVDNAIKALAQQRIEFEYDEHFKTLNYRYSGVNVTLKKNSEYVTAFQLIHPDGVSTYACRGFLDHIVDQYHYIK